MKPILEIQNISKKFMIHHEQQPYLSIRDSVSGIFKSKNKKQEFWALKDVSFEVMPSDTIGIIGKNGAGKSTLLKILSKITPPTSGKIIGRGRIASLLEVGTGFHPELSGRENVFMNGSILGMRRAEILKNFDAIVDFAGVDKFIDTPLKHYSSGMQLRLAFAVAAFLENEILIIDEVLAVGDAEFQKKCMGKMEDVSKNHGRTVLFVSHNITALQQLCSRGVLLNAGRVELVSNNIMTTITQYLRNSVESNEFLIEENKNRFGNREIECTGFFVVDENGKDCKNNVIGGSDIQFVFNYKLNVSFVNVNNVEFAVGIWNSMGRSIAMFSNKYLDYKMDNLKNIGTVICKVPNIPLPIGEYKINILIANNNRESDWIKEIGSFYVSSSDFFGTGQMYPNEYDGVYIKHNWNVL